MMGMNDTNWLTHLNNLVAYSNYHGVYVEFKRGREDYYTTDVQKITINSKRTLKNQTYILLHELGHHNILKDGMLCKKFAVLNQENVARNLSNRILSLEEEVIAWHIGEGIGRSLSIPLDASFQILKSRCLKTYVDSIASKKVRNNQ